MIPNLCRAVFIALLVVWSLPAAAAAYPTKPMRIIVAQAPGGASDLLIRMLSQKMSEPLGQPFVIDNRPGAGANVGAEIAAKAAPDGYSLFMVNASHAAAPSLYKKLAYDLMRDFAPINMVGSEPLCVVVYPSLPVRSIREFVAFLKENPGRTNYGSSGNGAVNHLGTELFKMKAGVQMQHVPYKGSGFAIPDVIEGRLSVLFANVAPLLPHIRSGRLRPLGVTSGHRVSALPDIPTIAESGYPGYEAINWFGIAAPARTPDSIVRTLNTAIRNAVNLPDVQEQYERRGAQPMTTSPQEMHTFLTDEIRKWAEVVRVSGARVD